MKAMKPTKTIDINNVNLKAWLIVATAAAAVVTVVICFPLLFIGGVAGWILCKNKDKLEALKDELFQN